MANGEWRTGGYTIQGWTQATSFDARAEKGQPRELGKDESQADEGAKGAPSLAFIHGSADSSHRPLDWRLLHRPPMNQEG